MTQTDAGLREQAARLTPLVSRMRRAVNRRVRAVVGGAPLPEAQLDVLRVVVREGAPRIQDVAVLLGLAPNTVSTLVQTMVSRGLLARQPDARDGRVVRLAATPTARRRIDSWRAHRSGLVAAHLARLGDADRRALERAAPALERLVASLERGDA